MDYTALIQSKMSKVECSLSELNNEILTAAEYLVQLKDNCSAVVRDLNSITEPAAYLKEFLNVNSFLLTSIRYLTEFNCKFEILSITGKSPGDLKFINKATSPNVKERNANDLEEHLSIESVVKLEHSEGDQVLKKDICKQQSNSCHQSNCHVLDNQREKEETKNKFEKSELLIHESKIDDIAKTTTDINDCNSNIKIGANTFFKNETETERNCSCVQSKSENVEDAVDNFEVVIPPKMVDIKVSAEENNKPSCSEICLPNKSSVTDSDDENSQSSIVSNCNSLVDDENSQSSIVSNCNSFTNNAYSISTKISCSATQSSGNIPVAEVVPTKIQEKNFKDSDGFNCVQNLTEDQPMVDDESKLDNIKPIELVRKLGEEYDIVIEYIKSPSEFYVSIINDERNLLMELENKLKQIPANNVTNKRNKLTKSILSREMGNHCLVYSKCDEIWCRAEITNWSLNFDDDFVNVFLMDYGESKCVSIYDLHAMPKYLKQYPPFTVRCHLYNVFPLDMDKNSNTLSWGKEATEEMKSLSEDSKSVRIRIAPSDSFHLATSLPVTLWLVDQGNECINELLVTSKYAVHGSVFEESEKKTDILDNHTEEILDNSSVEYVLNNWNPMKEDFESYKNSYDLDINDPSAIIYGYVGKDYERICLHFAKSGYCFKGEACRKEHKKFDYLGFTTDQEEVFQSAINNLPVPPPNSKLNIQVTYLLSYKKFFCIMESQNLSSNEETLQGMLIFMNLKENVQQMKKLLIPPSAGQIVIARYSVDRAWYRARVLESQPENDQYSVVFVDYGNSEVLPLSDIRAIEGRYLHLPFQAIQCCIFGIDENPKVPLKEVMDYMKEKMYDGHLSIEVIARLPGDNINLLVNVFDHQGESIGKDLIEKKYALTKEEMIISSVSESVPG